MSNENTLFFEDDDGETYEVADGEVLIAYHEKVSLKIDFGEGLVDTSLLRFIEGTDSLVIRNANTMAFPTLDDVMAQDGDVYGSIRILEEILIPSVWVHRYIKAFYEDQRTFINTPLNLVIVEETNPKEKE